MVKINVVCRWCGQEELVVKNGRSRAGHQRYLCGHCHRTFQLGYSYTACTPGVTEQIVEMAMNGAGCRDTGRVLGISLNTVLRHLKNSNRKT